MSEGDLATDCLHFKHLRILSESNAFHADIGPWRARGYPRLFLCDACKFWIGTDQAWCCIGILPVLLWIRRICPLGVLGGGSGFVVMLVKALVTSSAFALGVIHAWGLCHVFFGHFLPRIILLTF